MTPDPRCCGTGTCIINADGECWCGQKWDGQKMAHAVLTPLAPLALLTPLAPPLPTAAPAQPQPGAEPSADTDDA
jgi:hypothetical protein